MTLMMLTHQFKIRSHQAVDGLFGDDQLATIETDSATCAQAEEDGVTNASVIHKFYHLVEEDADRRDAHSVLK